MDAEKRHERVLSVRVTHPRHGEELVLLINPKKADIEVLAIREAARRWGVQWTDAEVLHKCGVEADDKPMYRVICDQCGASYPAVRAAEPCPRCEALERHRKAALNRRFKRQFAKKDRRVKAKS